MCRTDPRAVVSVSASAEANPVAGIPEYDAIPDIHLRLSFAACGNLLHRITINNSGAISSHMSILFYASNPVGAVLLTMVLEYPPDLRGTLIVPGSISFLHLSSSSHRSIIPAAMPGILPPLRWTTW